MPDEDARELASKILRFNFMVARWKTSHYDKKFNVNGRGDFALTVRQFSILMLADSIENLTVKKCEMIMDLSKSSLSLTISKLAKEGYLKKQPAAEKDDKRKVYIHITDKGKKELLKARERVIDSFEEFYLTLSETQKEKMKHAIKELDDVFRGGFDDEKEA